QDFLLVRFSWIAEIEPNQESVELCLGQGKCAVQLDRILRRYDQEWACQRESLPINGHLMFLHRFQQRRLRLRSGAIDFGSQQELGEDRSVAKLERQRALVEDETTGQIGRQQIGCALHALERQAQDLRRGARYRRLGQARYVLD